MPRVTRLLLSQGWWRILGFPALGQGAAGHALFATRDMQGAGPSWAHSEPRTLLLPAWVQRPLTWEPTCRGGGWTSGAAPLPRRAGRAGLQGPLTAHLRALRRPLSWPVPIPPSRPSHQPGPLAPWPRLPPRSDLIRSPQKVAEASSLLQ